MDVGVGVGAGRFKSLGGRFRIHLEDQSDGTEGASGGTSGYIAHPSPWHAWF
jgi:hypothetical protein